MFAIQSLGRWLAKRSLGGGEVTINITTQQSHNVGQVKAVRVASWEGAGRLQARAGMGAARRRPLLPLLLSVILLGASGMIVLDVIILEHVPERVGLRMPLLQDMCNGSVHWRRKMASEYRAWLDGANVIAHSVFTNLG